MTRFSLLAFVVVIAADDRLSGDDPNHVLNELRRYRGDWMINGDRHQLLRVRLTTDGAIETRSSVQGNCFQKIHRKETMWYDAEQEKYFAKIEYSKGKSWDCIGRWDENRMTLKWVAKIENGERHFTSDFQRDKKQVFTIQDFDQDGELGWRYREVRYQLGD
jgi:hypothetical protein